MGEAAGEWMAVRFLGELYSLWEEEQYSYELPGAELVSAVLVFCAEG